MSWLFPMIAGPSKAANLVTIQAGRRAPGLATSLPGEQVYMAAASADERGGLRLALAAAGGLLVAVPFGLLLLLVTDRWGPLRRLDTRLDVALNTYAYRHSGYVSLLKGVSLVGSPTTFEVLAVVVAVLLAVRRQPRLASWLVVCVVGGGLLSDLVKAAVGRARPLLAHPVDHAVSGSFPSGHALGSVVGVGALLLVGLANVPRAARRPLVVAGCGIVLAIGFSRLGLGVHYLSDVLGGYLLGAAWLMGTTAAFAAWRRDRGIPDRDPGDGLEPARPEEP